MVSVSGNFAGLHKLQGGLRRVARVPVEVRPYVAAEFRYLLAKGFATGTDPYGSPWAPRKSGGGWPLLVKTGRLLGSMDARPTGKGVMMTAGAPYAVYVDARRQILPSGTLPPAYQKAVEKHVNARMKGTLA